MSFSFLSAPLSSFCLADNDGARIDAEPGRRSSLGRMSDFALEMPEGLDGQTTFMMSEPGDDVAPTSPIAQEQAGPSEPVVNQEVDREETGVVAANAADAVPPTPAPAPMSEPSPPPLPMDDFSDREPIEDIPDRSDDEDREPMEDIPERSDDGGAPVDDAPPEDYDAPMDDGGGFSDAGGGEDDDAGGYDYDQDAAAPVDAVPDVSTTSATAPAARAPKRRSEGHVRIREAMPPRRKRKLISRHGIEYPSLPPTFVKRVAQTALQSSGLSNPRVSADTLVALTQASEWFFEQLGDDLGAFANHAKRKTIEESDVVTLMRRYVFFLFLSLICSFFKYNPAWWMGPYLTYKHIQATPDQLVVDRLLSRAATPSARAPSRAKDAHSRIGQEAQREAG